jgi:hypothetical protein
MVVDLDEFLRGAAARGELTAVEELVERATERAVRRVLGEVQADGTIDCAGLAKLLGCPTPTAAKRRVDRDEELRALALTGGGGRRWTSRRSDVTALLERRRAERDRGGAH